MKSKKVVSGEIVIREYPRSTRWLEDGQVVGVGNLVLTNRRLVFLNATVVDEAQAEKLRQLGEEGAPVKQVMDYAVTLHKKNFQIPLSSIIVARVGLYSFLPILRPCLRVYHGTKKVKLASFMFTIPLFKGFFQFEIGHVLSWVWIIRRTAKYSR